MKRIIEQYEPLITKNDIDSVSNYMSSGGWITEFKKTSEFSDKIRTITGSSFAHILSNGTVTLSTALLAVGIESGDEVLVPDFTMVASATSALLVGAKVVFVDIEKETLCIDYSDIIKKVTKKTKALVLVSINGRYPTRIEQIVQFCRENKVIIIEDAAQSLGSYYNGHHIGTIGLIASFSFSMPKIITTGQGGALITSDGQISKRITEIRDFGRVKSGEDQYISVGYNFKFTDLQAVLGLSQISNLTERIRIKRELFKLYFDNLSHLSQVKFIETNLNYTTPWFIDILVEDRENLMLYLSNNGIKTRKFYPSLHSEQAFEGYPGEFPNTDYITMRGLWLPSSLSLSINDVKYICKHIINFYNLK
jgi:perosamine synthetase